MDQSRRFHKFQRRVPEEVEAAFGYPGSAKLIFQTFSYVFMKKNVKLKAVSKLSNFFMLNSRAGYGRRVGG